METTIAYCGLICDSCPIHLATLEKDQSLKKQMRELIAEICSKQYGMKLVPEDISDCDGCKANSGILFSGCLDCEIRRCACRRNVESCAFCPDYACPALLMHFSLDYEAKVRLDKLRSSTN